MCFHWQLRFMGACAKLTNLISYSRTPQSAARSPLPKKQDGSGRSASAWVWATFAWRQLMGRCCLGKPMKVKGNQEINDQNIELDAWTWNAEINVHFNLRFRVLLNVEDSLYESDNETGVDNLLLVCDESVHAQRNTGNLMSHSQKQCWTLCCYIGQKTHVILVEKSSSWPHVAADAGLWNSLKLETGCVTLARQDWLKMPFLCPLVPDLQQVLLPCLVERSVMSGVSPGVSWQFTGTLQRGRPPSQTTAPQSVTAHSE